MVVSVDDHSTRSRRSSPTRRRRSSRLRCSPRTWWTAPRSPGRGCFSGTVPVAPHSGRLTRRAGRGGGEESEKNATTPARSPNQCMLFFCSTGLDNGGEGPPPTKLPVWWPVWARVSLAPLRVSARQHEDEGGDGDGGERGRPLDSIATVFSDGRDEGGVQGVHQGRGGLRRDHRAVGRCFVQGWQPWRSQAADERGRGGPWRERIRAACLRRRGPRVRELGGGRVSTVAPPTVRRKEARRDSIRLFDQLPEALEEGGDLGP